MVMDGYHSQDRLSKLREKINKQHLNYLTLEGVPSKHEIPRKLLDSIRDFLLIAPPSHKYLLPETSMTLHQSALLSTFTADKASKGWEAIAKYAANLIAQPWRKEYKEINTYSGYYKHKVEANLDTVADQMFQVMGYRMEEGGVLVLEGPVCPDQVTYVSLDAIFAHVECKILNEIYDEIYQSTSIEPTWSEILDFRDTHDCSPKETVRSLIHLSGAHQQQEHLTYNNTAHALQQLIDTSDGSAGGGVYYNNGPMLSYGGGGGKKLLNGSQNGQVMGYDQIEYGNIGGHALPVAYSFPPLRHHTQQPTQYYLPYDVDCYNRYSHCGGVANNGMIMPMQQYYNTDHHHGTPMLYHPGLKQQLPPTCCGGGNGYIVPDMSVPSTAAITPAQHHPTGCSLCNHPTSTSSIVPTAQLIDFDTSNHHHHHQLHHLQLQMGHDVPDGLATTPRVRNNSSQQAYYPQQRPSTTTTTNGTSSSNHHHHHQHHTLSSSSRRDNREVVGATNSEQQHHATTQQQRGNAHALVNEDVSGGDRPAVVVVGGNGGVKGERELRVEEGSGTYESWDYVYKNLASQGYSKDLGERGDILVSDRTGKRRIVASTLPKTTAAEIPEKLNGLTINNNDKPPHQHKTTTHITYERRNSDETTQSSYYDNVPAATSKATKTTITAPAVGSNKTQTTSPSVVSLMQQKMKVNRLSEVKAKVDSRRVSSKVMEMIGNESSNGDSRGGGGKENSHENSNGIGKRHTSSSQPDDPTTTTSATTTTTFHRPLLTKQPTSSSPTSPSTITWQCSSCTYLNTKPTAAINSTSANNNICEMCSKSRDIALLDTSMEIGGPQCLKCTLVNPKGAAICQACEKPLTNSPTYI